MKRFLTVCILCAMPIFSHAAEYVIDTKGAHAFIQFRVKHLGFSWLYGRFNDFEGQFVFDQNKPEKNRIEVQIDTASVDSNHTVRDKYLRGKDFLNVKAFPKASFVSTAYEKQGDAAALLKGDLTLHGQTHPVTIDIEHIGGGKDPWGGYREGFEGRTTIKPEVWGIPMIDKLGAASAEVELILTVEGVRKKKKKHKK